MSKIKTLYHKYEEIILYLFFGVITTLTNIITFYLSYEIFNINLLISNILAWILSVLVAYITNKLYVFKSKDKSFKELLSFFIARIFSLLVDTLIIYIGIDILLCNSLLIKILANIVVIILNYILSKKIIFKK